MDPDRTWTLPVLHPSARQGFGKGNARVQTQRPLAWRLSEARTEEEGEVAKEICRWIAVLLNNIFMAILDIICRSFERRRRVATAKTGASLR